MELLDKEQRFDAASDKERLALFQVELRETIENVRMMIGVFLSKLDEKGAALALEFLGLVEGGAPELQVEKTSNREVSRFIKHVNKTLRKRRSAVFSGGRIPSLLKRLKDHWSNKYDDLPPAEALKNCAHSED
jgi:hypothetical protein